MSAFRISNQLLYLPFLKIVTSLLGACRSVIFPPLCSGDSSSWKQSKNPAALSPRPCSQITEKIGLQGSNTMDRSSLLSTVVYLCMIISIYLVMSLQTLKVEELDQGRIVRVTISRPKSLNAMNKAFFDEVRDTFVRINTMENVRAVVLQAQGRLFSAGLDLKEMGSLFSSAESEDPARQAIKIKSVVKELQQPFVKIYECRVPVIVGVHNLCIGGGIDMISTTDIRYCTKDAQFSIKEIDIGMAADIGTLQFFPRRIGNQSTFRELLYTGRSMGADEALKIGLVSRIFEDKAQLEAGLLETARVIAAKSPVGIYTIKQVLHQGEAKEIYDGLDYIARTNSVMLQTKDTMEAIGAFLQKRKPEFPKL